MESLNSQYKLNQVQIDKDRFNKTINAYSVKIPVKEISAFQKKYFDLLFQIPKFKGVQGIEGDQDHKRIMIKRKSDDLEKYAQEQGLEIADEQVQLTYDNLNMTEILKEILPADVEEVPSGFETVGDIAHMNLMGKQLDYRYLIGQVVLEKNPQLRTVVTKIGQIESTYRFYDLDCIAGDDSTYETIVSEDKVRFKVDISKVYWCSKLASERTRIIDKIFKEGDVLCDMFCGIGPLAVKTAVKKRIKVLANDLNPAGVEYLKQNIALNKVQKLVIPFNMDAREFVKKVVRLSNDPLQTEIPEDFLRFSHCYMNLPVDAVEFLDAFIGLFNDANPKVWSTNSTKDPSTFQLPMIHVNGFTFFAEKDKALAYFVDRIGKAMNYPQFQASDVIHFHNIRDVSPQSHMYCVSFKLPTEVAFMEKPSQSEEERQQQIYEEFEDQSRKKIQKTQ